VDYVKEVTHREAFQWDEKDEQSASFNLTHPTMFWPRSKTYVPGSGCLIDLAEISSIEGYITKQGRDMTMNLSPKPGLKPLPLPS